MSNYYKKYLKYKNKYLYTKGMLIGGNPLLVPFEEYDLIREPIKQAYTALSNEIKEDMAGWLVPIKIGSKQYQFSGGYDHRSNNQMGAYYVTVRYYSDDNNDRPKSPLFEIKKNNGVWVVA